MIDIIRKVILTSLLSIKALFAGIVLFLSDLLLLLKSLFKYVFDRALGVRQTADVVIWNGFPSVLKIPSKENLDFNFWRKPTYVIPTLIALVKNKVKWLLEEKRVTPIPDEQLGYWITHGPLSRLAARQGECLSVDLAQVKDVETDEGVYLVGPKVEMKDNGEVAIRFSSDEVYTPDDGGLWVLSKLHIQAAAAYLLPGRFHGNIHFGLPCVSAASLSSLEKTDVLYQLLEPHVRFTLRINNEALRVQRAQDRTKPYAPFPVSGEEFVKSIAADVKQELMDPGLRCPPWSLQQEQMPFVQYGQAYYSVVVDFVNEIYPGISESEKQRWQHYMRGYIPGFERHAINEAIATIIWQVSFLHSADHYAMDCLMQSDKYLFSKMRMKSPRQSGITRETPTDQVVKMACDAEDRFRLNVFGGTFMRGHKHPLWSNTMDNIEYRFKEKALVQSARKFQSRLLETERALQEKELNICPLKNVFQSICW